MLIFGKVEEHGITFLVTNFIIFWPNCDHINNILVQDMEETREVLNMQVSSTKILFDCMLVGEISLLGFSDFVFYMDIEVLPNLGELDMLLHFPN